MPTPAERDEHRTKLLLAIYDMLGGRRHQMGDYRTAVTAANLDAADGSDAADWLVDHGLIEWAALGGQAEVTAAGIDEAERLLTERATATTGSVILDQTQRAEVEAVLHLLDAARASGEIARPTAEDEAELDADLRTIEVQSRSPRPKRDAVLGALRGIHDFITRPIQSNLVSASLVLAVQAYVGQTTRPLSERMGEHKADGRDFNIEPSEAIRVDSVADASAVEQAAMMRVGMRKYADENTPDGVRAAMLENRRLEKSFTRDPEGATELADRGNEILAEKAPEIDAKLRSQQSEVLDWELGVADGEEDR